MSIRVVTGTGFHGEAKRKAREALEQLGLSYSGDLVLGATDILLCGEELDLTNEKVKVARLWQLPIVSLDWLSACTTESRVLRTDRYLIRLRDDSEPPPMPGDAAASPSQHRVSDLRSSYPPTRLSRGRSSKEGSSQAAEPAGCSPKSPTSFLSQPFEILRSKKSSLTQQEAAEARFSAFQELAHSPGASMLTASPPYAAAASSAATPPMPPSPRSAPDCSPSPISTACASQPEHSGREVLKHLDNLGLISGTGSTDAPTSPDVPAEPGGSQQTPPSVELKLSKRLTHAPRNSTAASFHGCAVRDLTFYDCLEVKLPAHSCPLSFSMNDTSHCALTYYDDVGPDQRELAYCDLAHVYTTADGQAWIEHGYLCDRADLENHPMGRKFLEKHDIGADELVNSLALYHSPARVIEGEFFLYHSRNQARHAQEQFKDGDRLSLFTSKTWDRKSGRLIKAVHLS